MQLQTLQIAYEHICKSCSKPAILGFKWLQPRNCDPSVFSFIYISNAFFQFWEEDRADLVGYSSYSLSVQATGGRLSKNFMLLVYMVFSNTPCFSCGDLKDLVIKPKLIERAPHVIQQVQISKTSYCSLGMMAEYFLRSENAEMFSAHTAWFDDASRTTEITEGVLHC